MKRRILVDGDGCPVVNEVLTAAKRFGLECILLCDTAHTIQREGARTIVVSKGADSVDLALANMAGPGDVAVTQDYGLAALCLAKGARVLHQDGMEYTSQNIDGLLMARHTAQKIRRSGGRLKGPPKRLPAQNQAFLQALCALLEEKSQEEEA